MLIGRQSSGLVAHEGYLYVIAGGQGWDALTSSERYDPVADRWQMLVPTALAARLLLPEHVSSLWGEQVP